MSVDTSTLYGWASSSTVESAGTQLTSAGKGVDAEIDEAASDWNGIRSAYTEGPDVQTAYNAFDIIKDHGDAVREMSKMAGDALKTFAERIEGLQTRRSNAISAAEDVNKDLTDGKELPETGVGSEFAVQSQVDGVYDDYVQAAEECAETINSISVTTKPGGGFVASPEGGLVPGAGQAAMTMFEVESFTYRDLQPVIVQYTDYIPNGFYVSPWARWKDADGKISPKIGVLYGRKYKENTRFDVEWEDRGEVKSSWRPNWKPTDTKWRRWMSEHVPLYQKVVDQNPIRWNAPLDDRPKWYNVWGKGKAWVEEFADAGKGTKFLKGGNAVVSAVMFGVTVNDEQDKRYNELAAEHPDWTQEELEAASNEAGVVRGAAKTGVDVGAGMAGAAVGTAIGGPVGTVVGFGVGIGLSYLADKTGLKEGVADVAEGAWNGAKDFVGGLFD